MNRYILKNKAALLEDNLVDNGKSLYFQWCSHALGIILSKIFKPTISTAKKKHLLIFINLPCLIKLDSSLM